MQNEVRIYNLKTRTILTTEAVYRIKMFSVY